MLNENLWRWSKASGEDILGLLKRVHGEGAALLVVTTRREVAESLGGRVILLDDGRRVDAEGHPLRGDPPASNPVPPAPPPVSAAAPTDGGAP